LDINYDLVIKGGRVFTPHGLQSIDIWVRDGRIGALGGWHHAEERIDASGMLVLPGQSTPMCTSGIPAPITRRTGRAVLPLLPLEV